MTFWLVTTSTSPEVTSSKSLSSSESSPSSDFRTIARHVEMKARSFSLSCTNITIYYISSYHSNVTIQGFCAIKGNARNNSIQLTAPLALASLPLSSSRSDAKSHVPTGTLSEPVNWVNFVLEFSINHRTRLVLHYPCSRRTLPSSGI